MTTPSCLMPTLHDGADSTARRRDPAGPATLDRISRKATVCDGAREEKSRLPTKKTYNPLSISSRPQHGQLLPALTPFLGSDALMSTPRTSAERGGYAGPDGPATVLRARPAAARTEAEAPERGDRSCWLIGAANDAEARRGLTPRVTPRVAPIFFRLVKRAQSGPACPRAAGREFPSRDPGRECRA